MLLVISRQFLGARKYISYRVVELKKNFKRHRDTERRAVPLRQLRILCLFHCHRSFKTSRYKYTAGRRNLVE